MDIKQTLLDLNVIERIKGHSFVIYPYGYIGKKVKEILNNEYGIYELAIIDEYLNCYDDIRDTNFFDSPECKDAMIIIASDKLEIYEEIRDNVRKKFDFDRVIDISGAVNMQIDRRIESLRLCADILNRNKIKGAVAEAGVFEGDFAQYMNLFFKERNLYLFDTFEGFENGQLRNNVDDCWSKWMNNNFSFVSSGIDSVRNKMKYPDKCIFKKGFFPETTKGITETFCFVNLDMDIYQSTKDGLDFFWGRMEKRGIIFVHDYTSWNCPGVKRAVDEFCDINNVGISCLPDENGTIMLIK